MELAELAVFVRAPVPGSVKTRLHSALGPGGATELYRAFVEDVVARCQRVREAGRVGIALWADDASDPTVGAWAAALGTEPLQQPDDDLGVRLTQAFETGLGRAERVVVIGSDAPTLPLSNIALAFDRLADVPLVLGPSNDGGYVLIGASGASPGFDGVRWSTELAYRDTRAANASVAVASLPPWYDVDEEADLRALRAHLSVDPSAAPATAAALTRITAQR
jgi:rSAM/selenodomain-associated transferase 1